MWLQLTHVAGGLAFVSLLGCLAAPTPCKVGEMICRIGWNTLRSNPPCVSWGAEFQKRDPGKRR